MLQFHSGIPPFYTWWTGSDSQNPVDHLVWQLLTYERKHNIMALLPKILSKWLLTLYIYTSPLHYIKIILLVLLSNIFYTTMTICNVCIFLLFFSVLHTSVRRIQDFLFMVLMYKSAVLEVNDITENNSLLYIPNLN